MEKNSDNHIDPEKIEKSLERSVGDSAHTLIRSVLALIPIFGGPAVELFSETVPQPISNRKKELFINIAEAIQELSEKVDGFSIENLHENEMFTTTVIRAYEIAIHNHQIEKLTALRNSIMNSAVGIDLDENLQLMFLDLIDSFTPLHINILLLFDDPEEWATENGKIWPSWGTAGLADVIEFAFPDLRCKEDLYRKIWKDICNERLIENVRLDTTMTRNGLLASRTTELGMEFISFIKSPIED